METHRRFALPDPASRSSWHAHQLAAFLERAASLDDRIAIASGAVERLATALSAHVVAAVDRSELIASIGYPPGSEPVEELVSAALGARETVTIPGEGVIAVARSRPSSRGLVLIVARAAPGGYSPDELAVLNGVATATALAIQQTRADAERPEPARSPLAPERQRLTSVEDTAWTPSTPAASPSEDSRRPPDPGSTVVAGLQRAIREGVTQDCLLDQACRELLVLSGAEVVVVRTADGEDLRLRAHAGADHELAARCARLDAGQGLGRPAYNGGGLITVLDPDRTTAAEELCRFGCDAAAIAALEGGDGIHGTIALGYAIGGAGAFPDRAEDALALVADCCALALDRDESDPGPPTPELPRPAGLDGTTELLGRAALVEACERAISSATDPDAAPALILLDLDGFRRINDTLGQEAGDRLLRAVARRFRAAVRPADVLARIGEDEFAVLAGDLPESGGATRLVRRLQEAMREPFVLAEREVAMSVSSGVALGGGDAEGLLRAAGLALAEARSKGPGRNVDYRAELGTAALSRLETEVDIQRALQREQLVVHYQPILDLESLRPVSFEALVRWRHPTRGLVPPGRFIPAAERTGLITPIGRWVLRAACRQLASWRAEHEAGEELTISVNLSPDQLHNAGLVDDVEEALALAELNPGDLTLEITESVLISDTAEIVARLEALRGLGVSIAIDDFGAGYSSLRYIERFPIDAVKIDRSFTGAGEAGELPVLRAMVEMSAGLGLRMVAEGVEEAHQPIRLLELGCRYGQGILLGAPAPARAATGVLRARSQRASIRPR